MTADQNTVLDWLAVEEARGWVPEPMPFKLAKFKGIRDSLVRAGLVTKTETGRYVQIRTSLCAPAKQLGQPERAPEGIA